MSMSEFPPAIAPQDDGSGVTTEVAEDVPEPPPITEEEVGEYREQDRFLPVRVHTLLVNWQKCRAHNLLIRLQMCLGL